MTLTVNEPLPEMVSMHPLAQVSVVSTVIVRGSCGRAPDISAFAIERLNLLFVPLACQ